MPRPFDPAPTQRQFFWAFTLPVYLAFAAFALMAVTPLAIALMKPNPVLPPACISQEKPPKIYPSVHD